MKILVASPPFLPSIGGIENIAAMLARQFARHGHDVVVATFTPGNAADDAHLPYRVSRNPGWRKLCSLVRWCEVCLHMGVSLRMGYPLLWHRRPWVVSFQTWYSFPFDARVPLPARVKRFAARFAAKIACSEAMAKHVGPPCVVIPNPYDSDCFRVLPGVKRERDLLFVGRLVSDKGANLLLDALAQLGQRGLHPTTTIAGSGPDEPALRLQANQLGLRDRVHFAGPLRGSDLAHCMNSHRILVVPSVWDEPFGIVALEGAACGCVVVGSSGGGLPEAIGPCGLTFPNGDVNALEQCLANLLSGRIPIAQFHSPADRHLMRHRLEMVAEAYLKVLSEDVSLHSH